MTDREPHELGVVVGYDGSAGSLVALEWAAWDARREDHDLTVLHCVDLARVPTFPVRDPSQLTESLAAASHAVLEDGVRHAAKILPEGRIHERHVIGSAVGRLVEASRDADLVVVGSRAHGRFRSGRLGSTAYAVAAHAHAPVVVVRSDLPVTTPVTVPATHVPPTTSPSDVPLPPAPGPDHKVVVGIDDSPAAAHALDRAAAIADDAGATLEIVRALPSDDLERWTWGAASMEGSVTTRILREHAGHSLAAAASRIAERYPDLAVETTAASGNAGRALAQLSAGAGLMVVGARGHGGFAGLRLGSVTHRVLHDASCPVMVVR